MTEKEFAEVEALAAERGVSLSEWCREVTVLVPKVLLRKVGLATEHTPCSPQMPTLAARWLVRFVFNKYAYSARGSSLAPANPQLLCFLW
jgi:hypothetical protein